MDTRAVPDSLWLSILSYLDLGSLLNISQVCRHFYRLSNDRLFWQRIDLSPIKNLKLNNLYKLLKTPRIVNVKSLRWEGFLRRSTGFIKNTKRPSQNDTMTAAALRFIGEKCPNLKEFHLTYGDLNNLDLNNFPPKLTYLGLEGSVIPFDFFAPLDNPNVLPNLTGLDLNNVHNLSSLSRTSVPALLTRRHLSTLLIKNCFKVSSEHALQIPLQLTNLNILNLSQLVVVDDDVCYNIGRHCKQLKELDLSFCYTVTDQGVGHLVCDENAGGCNLRRLSLVELGLTDHVFIHLSRMPRLEYANLVKTKCTSERLIEFSREHPTCRVDHKYSEASQSIGGSFWILNLEHENGDGSMEH